MEGAPAAPTAPRRHWPLAAAGALFVALWWTRARHVIDDGYIVLRYARSFAETGVPRFNAGVEPPVEGYSDFLWMSVLALAHRIGLPLPPTAEWLGLAAGLGTLAVSAHLLRRFAGAHGLRLFGGLALVATAPALVVGSSGGLETSLFSLLVVSTFALLAGSKAGGSPIRVGLLGGALALGVALARVEGFLWVLVLLAAAALVRDEGAGGARRRFATAFAVYLVGFTGYLLWRKGVHGDWLSNTVAAKSGLSVERVGRGARYVGAWALTTLTPLVSLAIVPLALKRHASAGAVLFVLAAFAGYALLVGGDWMPYWRFLAPAAPFVALALALSLRRLARSTAVAVLLALAVVQVLPLFGVALAPRPTLEALRFRGFRGDWQSEWQRLETARTNGAHFAALGQALDEALGAGEGLVFGAIGAVGWFAPELFLHDRNGLVDREVARLDSDVLAGLGAGAGTAGHDRRVPRAWFLSRREPATPTIFHATLVEAPIEGPSSPLYAPAVVGAMRGQILRQRGEEALLEATIVEARRVSGDRTLLLWRRAPAAEARAFWGALGVR